MTKSICIYTVITNDYDVPKKVVLNKIPHILFTDNPNINAPGWQIVEVEKTKDQRLQRKLKILGHPELDKYDVTVYVDGSMTLKPSFANIINAYRGGMVIGKHPTRKCVYAEGIAVKELKKAPKELVDKQIYEYYINDFPANFGMWAAGVVIRDKSLKEMNEIWYSKLKEHSHRDQLSLPFALWKTGIKPKEIDMYKYITISKHKTKEPLRIVYLSPHRADKNIGKAYNDDIALIPDNAWIVIHDSDACFLLPESKTYIEQMLMIHGEDYGLIGCVTNRLGGLHQCYEGIFSEDTDIRNHYNKSLEAWKKYSTLVEPTTGVAGLCMIFKKSTWQKVGGFNENTITADTEFNKAISKIGLKIGLSKGIYMFHSYRIWEIGHKKAWSSTKHLK